jgi:Tol biopolymer transport system component
MRLRSRIVCRALFRHGLPDRLPAKPVLWTLVVAACVGLMLLATACGRQRASVAPTSVPAGLGKLAYVLDGTIWVKDLPNGTPQRITSQASSPRWSPSGQWLTFRSGKTLGVMRADGSDARLFTNADQLVWSPVADRLAYTTFGAETAGGVPAGTLVVENADGSQRKAVAHWSSASDWDFGVWEPAWSADGTSMAYVEQSGPAGPSPVDAGIWRVPADGSSPPTEVFRAPNPTQEGVGVIGWTRDGAIVFCPLSWLPSDRYPEESVSSDGVPLREVRPDTGQVIDFAPTVPTVLLQPELRSFAPTGDLLAITDGAGHETWTSKQVALLSTASASIMSVTDRGIAAIEPSWSPDAQHIAYSAAPDTGAVYFTGDVADIKAAMAPRKIWLMDAYAGGQYGATPRQLTSDPAYRDELPQWSADGTQILFARLDAQDHWSLWLMTSSGGVPREVVPEIGSPEIAWRVGYDEQIDVRGLPDWLDWWRGAPNTKGAGTVEGGSASVESPQKQAIETAEAIRQITAEAGPHASESAVVVTAVPTRASCPVDNSTVQTKITGPIYQPPPGSASIFNQITLVSEATAVGADGRPYSLYVGTLTPDNSQWVIVRWRGAKDPCVEGRTAYDPEIYLLPLKSQVVTLTRIDGNSLSFQTPDGRSGSFNYTTGTFSTATP